MAEKTGLNKIQDFFKTYSSTSKIPNLFKVLKTNLSKSKPFLTFKTFACTLDRDSPVNTLPQTPKNIGHSLPFFFGKDERSILTSKQIVGRQLVTDCQMFTNTYHKINTCDKQKDRQANCVAAAKKHIRKDIDCKRKR